jgi:hypothetical protein
MCKTWCIGYSAASWWSALWVFLDHRPPKQFGNAVNSGDADDKRSKMDGVAAKNHMLKNRERQT